ncbi:uncharacterized protein LOC135818612 isoform X1 [Sycon ciliatum]|uniref:uncharacterized protein LOC135818612 isoform X1 n=1 Tax=Sycon ciliatum TaxID=27933 RepID=UPI0031F646AC
MGKVKYAALSAENQRSYGSTIRRVSGAYCAQQCSTDEFECWICYDVESRESGPLICPCDCKGGTAAVHHNCLKRWLLEQGELSQRKVPQCDICKKPYVLDRTRRFKFSCTTMQGLRSSLLICVIVAMPITVTFVIKHVPFHDLAKYTVIVVTAVLELVCLRLLGVTFDSICHRAMVAAVTILGPHPSSIQPPEDTTAEATSLPPSMPPAAATLDEMDKLQQQQHEHEPCSSPGTVLLLRRTPSPSIEDQQNSTYAVSAAANLPTSPPYPQSSIQQCSSSSDLIPSSRSQSVLFAVRPLA